MTTATKTSTGPIHVTQATFQKDVVQSKLPVIVDFWASWCGPCRMLAPIFEELAKEYTGKLTFAKVDTEQDGDLASDHGVTGIPCLIIFSNGQEVDRIIGFSPRHILKMKIDSVLSEINRLT